MSALGLRRCGSGSGRFQVLIRKFLFERQSKEFFQLLIDQEVKVTNNLKATNNSKAFHY